MSAAIPPPVPHLPRTPAARDARRAPAAHSTSPSLVGRHTVVTSEGPTRHLTGHTAPAWSLARLGAAVLRGLPPLQ